jgi:hypothetical protein
VNRALLAAAAALIVVVGAVTILPRLVSNVGPPGPSSSPPASTATPPPSTQPTQDSSRVPDELMHVWVGAPHDFPGAGKVDALHFEFYFGQVIVHANFGKDLFDSPITVTGPNTLQLTGLSNGCAIGLVGHYTWSLSRGGTLLHLVADDDACPARSAALAGDWHAANCKDQTDMCWGDLEAGTYPTLFYGPRLDPAKPPTPNYGGVTFTVPDGWAVAGDRTSDFRLLRSSDYAKEGPTGPVGQPTEIEGWIRPTPIQRHNGCTRTPMTGPYSPTGIVNQLRDIDGLTIGPSEPITIDGHAGLSIDVSLAPTATGGCVGFDTPSRALVMEGVGSAGPVGDEPYFLVISGNTRMRLIFVELSQPAVLLSQTALILVTAPDQTAFDSFVNEAMPIIESFHFK